VENFKLEILNNIEKKLTKTVQEIIQVCFTVTRS
jgi:hypothetical protein